MTEGLENPLLDGLWTNAKLISLNYLSSGVYFFFLFSLIVFFLVFFTKTPPFNDPLTKRIALLLVSIIWLLLFFEMFFQIFLIILGLVWVGLYSIRTELSQFLIIRSYQSKSLTLNLTEDQTEGETDLITGTDKKAYEDFSFFILLIQVKEIFLKIYYFLKEKSQYLSLFTFYGGILLTIGVLLLGYEVSELYKTYYILKTID